MKIRTRFPPSPTGPLHMGNVRTLLFNYLFAKKEGGEVILRIEDTDKERSRPEWEQDIVDNLKWLGLDWDEFYRQSERTELYQKYLEQLLQEQRAYYCFCTPEELDAQRQHQMSLGETPRYIGACRNLSKEEQQKRREQARAAVIRFIVEPKVVTFRDLIRKEIKFDGALLGDIVVAKDLQTPLYNFSVVVDDYEMRITHVIRGEDHIPNTPKQILLQEALGFPKVQYAHLPLLLGQDRTKLSKRHGDTSVKAFREQGYLPEAVINFLALLGWNPGTDKEIFSLQQLIKEFSLDRIQKGGAVFNIQRLDWINGFYIRQKSLEKLAELCLPYLIGAGLLAQETTDSRTLARIVALYQERLKKLSEISELTDFFFKKQLEYPKELLRWKDATDQRTKISLSKLESLLDTIQIGEWTREKIEAVLIPEAEKEKNRGYMLWPLRVALSGKKASAGPFEIAEVLGKEKTLQRVKEAIQNLSA